MWISAPAADHRLEEHGERDPHDRLVAQRLAEGQPARQRSGRVRPRGRCPLRGAAGMKEKENQHQRHARPTDAEEGIGAAPAKFAHQPVSRQRRDRLRDRGAAQNHRQGKAPAALEHAGDRCAPHGAADQQRCERIERPDRHPLPIGAGHQTERGEGETGERQPGQRHRARPEPVDQRPGEWRKRRGDDREDRHAESHLGLGPVELPAQRIHQHPKRRRRHRAERHPGHGRQDQRPVRPPFLLGAAGNVRVVHGLRVASVVQPAAGCSCPRSGSGVSSG